MSARVGLLARFHQRSFCVEAFGRSGHFPTMIPELSRMRHHAAATAAALGHVWAARPSKNSLTFPHAQLRIGKEKYHFFI